MQRNEDAHCGHILKQCLKQRGVMLSDLATFTGLPLRTLEGYMSSKDKLLNAKAKTVLLIADFLEVDPFTLLGYDTSTHISVYTAPSRFDVKDESQIKYTVKKSPDDTVITIIQKPILDTETKK